MFKKLDKPQYSYTWILIFQVYLNLILHSYKNRAHIDKKKRYLNITVVEITSQ